MDSAQIENKLKDLTSQINHESFLFDLLTVYDFPKATLSRLKKGDANLSKNEDEYLLKNKVLFKAVHQDDPHYVIDELTFNENILKHRPRFIIVTNFKNFLAQDTKTKDSLDIQIELLPDHYDFFFPWIGREKSKIQNESVADIKAANKMAQLYDLLINANPTFKEDETKKHALNLFFARLLFCFFAEDTELFEEHLFSKTFEINSNEDGSNSHQILEQIFHSLDNKDKNNFPSYCKKFPFVGGDLFHEKIEIPLISRNARSIIIEAGKLDWYVINPDIFGSMIQVIASPEERSNLGAHYTSVVNILKVINPLFMDSLNEQFDKCESEKDYEKLLKRIYSLKIFDPACGSGNFLIITYKELCRLEFKIYSTLQSIDKHKWKLISLGLRLNQFYGISIKDFDVQIARLSMYIVNHQMNIELEEIYGDKNPTIPFQDLSNITCSNSLRVDWNGVCENRLEDEIYIVGNPPYLGSKKLNLQQKEDMEIVFNSTNINFLNIDYICAWFYKANAYIHKRGNCAFVSTSSICQGEHITFFWNYLINKININFGYTPFQWRNNASNNAAVYCIIVGIGQNSKEKYLIDENGVKTKCKNINFYLLDGEDVVIEKHTKSISNLPSAGIGNKPIDNGNYLFSDTEKDDFLKIEPQATHLFYRWYGADEFMSGKDRWVLLVSRLSKNEIINYPQTRVRIENVKKFRLGSSSKTTNNLAKTPDKFHVENFPNDIYFVIPKLISKSRPYVPVGVFSKDQISSDLLNVIDTNDLFYFSILSSKLHYDWVDIVGGKMGNSLRYSVSICYNSFPVGDISSSEKDVLRKCAMNIIDCREKYSHLSMSDLYDSSKMPDDLKLIHEQNDKLVDKILLDQTSLTREQRVSFLFNKYKLIKNYA